MHAGTSLYIDLDQWALRLLLVRAPTSLLIATGMGRANEALVYQGPGKKALEEQPIPQIREPSDAIVRINKTTICGTDLHILKGDVPTSALGRVLGHEASV